MLQATGIGYCIGTAHLLRDASIIIEPGQVLGILGPNGAGKSTLLRLLAGELGPSAGSIAMNGRALSAWKKREAARVRAVLPQSSSLSFPFKVHEVVMIGRNPHLNGVETAEDQRIVEAAMDRTDIGHLSDRVYPTLSGGERQRVHLARVLAQISDAPDVAEPRYLLLDEPTTGLDVRHQHLTMRVARDMAARGAGVAAILHDFNLAAMYADRIAVLSHGRLAVTGTPAEVFTSDMIDEVFELRAIVSTHPETGCPLIIDAMAK